MIIIINHNVNYFEFVFFFSSWSVVHCHMTYVYIHFGRNGQITQFFTLEKKLKYFQLDCMLEWIHAVINIDNFALVNKHETMYIYFNNSSTQVALIQHIFEYQWRIIFDLLSIIIMIVFLWRLNVGTITIICLCSTIQIENIDSWE